MTPSLKSIIAITDSVSCNLYSYHLLSVLHSAGYHTKRSADPQTDLGPHWARLIRLKPLQLARSCSCYCGPLGRPLLKPLPGPASRLVSWYMVPGCHAGQLGKKIAPAAAEEPTAQAKSRAVTVVVVAQDPIMASFPAVAPTAALTIQALKLSIKFY